MSLTASLLSELAACRNAFPVPPPGSELEQLWAAAIGDPESVAEYVQAYVKELLKAKTNV